MYYVGFIAGEEPNGKDIVRLVGKLNELRRMRLVYLMISEFMTLHYYSEKRKEALKKIMSDHQGTVRPFHF